MKRLLLLVTVFIMFFGCDDGAKIIKAVGPQGPVGPRGVQGERGNDGVNGHGWVLYDADGNAVDLAVEPALYATPQIIPDESVGYDLGESIYRGDCISIKNLYLPPFSLITGRPHECVPSVEDAANIVYLRPNCVGVPYLIPSMQGGLFYAPQNGQNNFITIDSVLFGAWGNETMTITGESVFYQTNITGSGCGESNIDGIPISAWEFRSVAKSAYDIMQNPPYKISYE